VFSALTEEFLDEYGLFIDVFREESKKEETVLVQLDSLCEEKGCLHLSADFEKSATIFFRLNEKGKKIGSVFPITQQALEFLIFMQFGHVSEETIRLFCKEYSTKIDKIRK